MKSPKLQELPGWYPGLAPIGVWDRPVHGGGGGGGAHISCPFSPKSRIHARIPAGDSRTLYSCPRAQNYILLYPCSIRIGVHNDLQSTLDKIFRQEKKRSRPNLCRKPQFYPILPRISPDFCLNHRYIANIWGGIVPTAPVSYAYAPTRALPRWFPPHSPFEKAWGRIIIIMIILTICIVIPFHHDKSGYLLNIPMVYSIMDGVSILVRNINIGTSFYHFQSSIKIFKTAGLEQGMLFLLVDPIKQPFNIRNFLQKQTTRSK